ncbi:MAG: flavin reductase [Candidatus Eremiobacterota bacterium]
MNVQELVELDLSEPIWSRFFVVAPLVLIGTTESDGRADLAPKHMAFPLGWDNYFGFVCCPGHATYRNLQREGCFGVSFPRPAQVLDTTLAASPRCGPHHEKSALGALPTCTGTRLNVPLLEGAYLYLECELDRIVDGFGPNSLVAGIIREARVDARALRRDEDDDHETIARDPLLVYLQPGRFGVLRESHGYPFPRGFHR